MGENIKLDQIVERLPNEWAEDLIPKIIQILKDESFRLAVIDDDPAGTQTVSDVTIMNKWNYDSILKQFNVSNKALFFNTNNRTRRRRGFFVGYLFWKVKAVHPVKQNNRSRTI